MNILTHSIVQLNLLVGKSKTYSWIHILNKRIIFMNTLTHSLGCSRRIHLESLHLFFRRNETYSWIHSFNRCIIFMDTLTLSIQKHFYLWVSISVLDSQSRYRIKWKSNEMGYSFHLFIHIFSSLQRFIFGIEHYVWAHVYAFNYPAPLLHSYVFIHMYSSWLRHD